MFPACVIEEHMIDEELQDCVMDWITQVFTLAGEHGKIGSAVLIANHWHPVVIISHATGVTVKTTPEGFRWLQPPVGMMSTKAQIETLPLPRKFENDCGFQTVAWLGGVLDQHCEVDVTIQGISGAVACGWRELFECSIRGSGEWSEAVGPVPMSLGGGGQFDPHEKVVQLLKDHGVPEAAAHDRATVVLDKLGRVTVLNILRSTSPLPVGGNRH